MMGFPDDAGHALLRKTLGLDDASFRLEETSTAPGRLACGPVRTPALPNLGMDPSFRLENITGRHSEVSATGRALYIPGTEASFAPQGHSQDRESESRPVPLERWRGLLSRADEPSFDLETRSPPSLRALTHSPGEMNGDQEESNLGESSACSSAHSSVVI